MTTELTVITNARVVTMAKDSAIYPNGAVAIRGRNIEAVGTSDVVLAGYGNEPHVTVDACGALLMPGLIDGHTHPTQYFLGGYSDTESDTMRMLMTLMYPLEKLMPPSLAKAGAKLCFGEMIRNGVTCFNDPGGDHPDAIGEAALEVGIRGTICRSTRDMLPQGWPADQIRCDDLATNVRASEALLERWNGAAEGRLRGWLSLRNPYTSSDKLVVSMRDLARQKHVNIHAHLASNFGDRDSSIAECGKGVVDRYRDLGVLAANFYAAHMCELNESEFDTVLERQISIAHCPVCYVKTGGGLGTLIPELVEAGVQFAIGTDGAPFSGSQDIFRVMFAFATAYCEVRRRVGEVGPYAALEAATIGGAQANAWNHEIGSLEPGKRADLILVDTSGPEWRYHGRDTARALVYSGNGDKVRSVWVDGRQLLRDRVLVDLDISGIVEGVAPELASLRKSMHLAAAPL